MLKNIINRNELAKILNVNVSTISRWIEKGLPYVELANGRKGYIVEEVEKWLLGEK